MSSPTPNIAVKVQVGEKNFEIERATLEKSPWWRKGLAVLPRNKTLILDADGDIFVHILRYLRTSRFPLLYSRGSGFDYTTYAEILSQAEKYELDTLADWIRSETYRNAVTTKTTLTCGLPYQDEEFTSVADTAISFQVTDDADGVPELGLTETEVTVDYAALVDRDPPPYHCACCACKCRRAN